MATSDDRLFLMLCIVTLRLAQDDVSVATDVMDALSHASAGAASVGDAASSKWFAEAAERLYLAAPPELQARMRADLDRRGIPL